MFLNTQKWNYPKNPKIVQFQTPQNPSDLPITFNLEYPHPLGVQFILFLHLQ